MAIPRLDEVAFALGAPKDPLAIWNAAFRQLTKPLADLLTRTVSRLPVAEVRQKDDDNPKIEHRVKLKPGRLAGVDELALKFALVARKVPGGAALLVDEARRMALNQPKGPNVRARKRSLDDSEGVGGGGHGLDGVADRALVAVSLDDLDEESMGLDGAFLGDELWRNFGQPVAFGHMRAASSLDGEPRSLVPLAAAAAILAVVVPILVAIIPTVLPMVMDAGSRFIESMKAGADPLTAIGDAVDPAGKQKRDDAAAAVVDDENTKRNLMIAGGVVAALIVAVIIYRRVKS